MIRLGRISYLNMAPVFFGLEADVEEVSGETFAGLFGDFGIALYADSVPGIARSRIPARYRFAGPPHSASVDRVPGPPLRAMSQAAIPIST